MNQRLRLSILLAVVVGALTGLGVAFLHWVIQDIAWSRLSARSDWWVVLLPVVGLILSSAFVHMSRDRSTETTEDYVRVFHSSGEHLSQRSVPLRMLAAASTIALGGSLGLEGPSIYLGALIGDAAERFLPTWFREEEARGLLVAGAAAGIAAIFKAPLTGIIFALEVPYRGDLARRALVPAMFAASTSYAVYASIVGTRPIIPIQSASFRVADMPAALLVGLACGIGARIFIGVQSAMARMSHAIGFKFRPVIFGVLVAVMGALSLGEFHLPLALGPGYDGILKAAHGEIGALALIALVVMKMIATASTSAGNGVGGLFFPSVMMGAAIGATFNHVFTGPPSLFAVVGIAAFLGGAYNVPLAGVAFVAEATGAPAYIIPGLLAAAVAYLASGGLSLSHRQRARTTE